MTWLTALYRCALGHEHRLTVGKVPPILELPHGVVDGKLPKCRLPLLLVTTERTLATVPPV